MKHTTHESAEEPPTTATLLGANGVAGYSGFTFGTTPLVIPTPEMILSAAVNQFTLPTATISPTMFMKPTRVVEMPAPTSTPSSHGTPPDPRRGKMEVPRCSICGVDSTGIHFGCEACAACSAFFRRSVVLNKRYECGYELNCNVVKGTDGSQKCRYCRYQKCLRVGMDTNAVQHRRDAIGKYSETAVKRECESPLRDSPSMYTTPLRGCLSPPSPKSPRMSRIPTALDEFVSLHGVLNKKRKLFYTSTSLTDVFDETLELAPMEVTNFEECMYQLWRVEPRLCADFISSNKFLAELRPPEKTKLLKNFLLLFQAVEEPYLTWKYGGLEKKWWIMQNRIYLDFNRAEYYFENFVMNALNLDRETAEKIFLPSFQHAMDLVGAQMKLLDISETEMIALASILLCDPTVPELEQKTRDLMKFIRDQLIKDLLTMYEADESIDYPEVRLGNLILIISGIKVHAQKSRENMQMLKIFDIVPRDNLFDELVGIDNEEKAEQHPPPEASS